jgi:hypothetical protein
MIKRCDTIKEWRLAPDMVEHNLSHLTLRLLSLANGDYGFDMAITPSKHISLKRDLYVKQ